MNLCAKTVWWVGQIRIPRPITLHLVVVVLASFVLTCCDSNRFNSSEIAMGCVNVSKGEEIESMAKTAEKALHEKGEIWKVEVDQRLAETSLHKNGSVGGSMLMLLWLIKDLGYDSQVDPKNRCIKVMPSDR